jgi:4-amino-4-deoxy-L-arabinose transferase-like glycosyltransferase
MRERLTLWGIVLAAGLLRLAYAMTPRVVRWDEAGHLLVARNLISGNGYSELAGTPDVHLPPLLPLLSAGLLGLGCPPDWATAAIHILTGALLCLPVYGLAQAIYGRRAGWIAACLVAVYPALAAWPFLWGTMTESPFLLLTFGGVWAVRQGLERQRTGCYALAGALFGLSYLTRPEGLIWLAVLGLFAALWHLARGSLFRPATVGRLALAMVACLLVMSPYILYLHQITGHWVLSGKVGLVLDIVPAYLAHDQALHDLAVARLDSTGQEIMWFSPERFEKSLADYVLANPRRFLYYVRQNMAETWRVLFHQDLFSPWVVALAAVGMFGRPWSRRRWWDEGLLWAALVPLASFWAFFVIDRFLVAGLVPGLIWAAAGLEHLAGWARASSAGLARRPASGNRPGPLATLAPALPLAAVLAFCLWVTPERLWADTRAMPWSHVAAGLWLAGEAAPDAVIMTRHTEVGLYANRPSIACPNAEWEQVLAYGRRRGARYLVVDTWELTTLRPQLRALLDPAQAPPEVESLAVFRDHVTTTLVYRLRGGSG